MLTIGVAAFLSPSSEGIPLPLSRLCALTGSVPARILLLTILIEEIPVVADADRVEVSAEDEARRVKLRFSFVEPIHVPNALALAVSQQKLLPGDLEDLVFYVGSETIIPSREIAGMAYWRDQMFAFMRCNAEPRDRHRY